MTCQEFLAQYSDYLDELMGPADAARLRAHLERCAACARYDRVVRRGLALVRELPPIEPSRDYYPRFQQRLVLEEEFRASRLVWPGAAMALAVVGALALLAWSPLLMRQEQPVVELAPVAARSPALVVEEGRWEGQPAYEDRAPGAPGVVPVATGLSPWWVQPASRIAFPPTRESFPADPYSPLMIELSSFERAGTPLGPGAWASYPATLK